MKLKEITGKSIKELNELLKEKQAELFNINLENRQHKLKNTRSIFNTRKEIAKILTLIREKELANPANENEGKEAKAATA
jgi:large subunit ribosomal protein L29